MAIVVGRRLWNHGCTRINTDGAPERPSGRFHAMPTTFYPCASVFIRGFNSLALPARRISARTRDLPPFARLPWGMVDCD
jgi:hypothetical protein